MLDGDWNRLEMGQILSDEGPSNCHTEILINKQEEEKIFLNGRFTQMGLVSKHWTDSNDGVRG